MNKAVRQIRDLDLIEEVLNSNRAGIFSFISKEKICQFAATYIYRNKNVYVFINQSEEVHLNMKPDTEAGFSILNFKEGTSEKNNPDHYALMYVTIFGTANNLSDQKLIDEVADDYYLKYGKKPELKKQILTGIKIILIDSQEIQAFEETGS